MAVNNMIIYRRISGGENLTTKLLLSKLPADWVILAKWLKCHLLLNKYFFYKKEF